MRLRKMRARLYTSPFLVLIVMAIAIPLTAYQPSGIHSEGSTVYVEKTLPETEEIEALPLNNSVVVDNEYMTITILDITERNNGDYCLNFEMENKTNKNTILFVDECRINGYMIRPICASEVKPNSTITDRMVFEIEDLELANIEEFSEIMLKFSLTDTEYTGICSTDFILLDTGIDYVQQYDDSGTLLYDENNIKIVMKDIDYSNTLEGPRILLYIENNNNISLHAFLSELKINGCEIDDFFIHYMSPNSRLISYVGYFETPKQQHDIDDFEKIEMKFSFMDIYLGRSSIFIDTITVYLE